MTGEDSLQERLTAFLADGTDGVIANLAPAGLGRSRDNWLFDLVTTGADGERRTEPLILRSDPPGGLVDTDRAVEFAVLDALGPSPLPTPQARGLDATGDRLGRPSLIMGREPGACDYRVVNGDLPQSERLALAEAFCDLLADVHCLDWRAYGLDRVVTDPGPRAALHELDRWSTILHQDQLEAWPELELAISVLRRKAPDSNHTVLVHADFKPGNILLEDGRITALLDWELAHLGDPLEDVGWVLQPLRRKEHLIEGVWERSDLLDRYSRRTGFDVDPAALEWWITFSTFKTAVMQVSGLRSFLEARSDEPYRPTRRVLATLLDSVARLDVEGG